MVWVDSCADAYALAALYANLHRFSDAELQRRGLARDALARDLLENVTQRTAGRRSAMA